MRVLADEKGSIRPLSVPFIHDLEYQADSTIVFEGFSNVTFSNIKGTLGRAERVTPLDGSLTVENVRKVQLHYTHVAPIDLSGEKDGI